MTRGYNIVNTELDGREQGVRPKYNKVAAVLKENGRLREQLTSAVRWTWGFCGASLVLAGVIVWMAVTL